MNNTNTIIKEKEELCAKMLIMWNFTPDGNLGEDYSKSSFIYNVIHKKLEAFEIDVVIPDYLIALIEICTNGNPGLSQIILKDLLMSVPNLKEGYRVTSMDFSLYSPFTFPIIEKDTIREKYEKLYIEQKKERANPLDSDNLMDTIGYWKEIFK